MRVILLTMGSFIAQADVRRNRGISLMLPGVVSCICWLVVVLTSPPPFVFFLAWVALLPMVILCAASLLMQKQVDYRKTGLAISAVALVTYAWLSSDMFFAAMMTD